MGRNNQLDDRAEFECVRLCPDCGWFDWGATRCDECGSDTHDLTHEPTALANRDALHDARQDVTGKVQNAGQILAVIGSTLVFGGVFFWFGYGHPALIELGIAGVSLGVCVGAALAKEVSRGVARLLPAWDPPTAWRRHRSVTQSEIGISEMVAPFSGVECSGWRVIVECSSLDSSREWDLAIDESRAVSSEVESMLLGDEPGSVPEVRSPEPDRLARYLRQRGLYLADGEYRVFERTSTDYPVNT